MVKPDFPYISRYEYDVINIVEKIQSGEITTPYEVTAFVGDKDRATYIFNSPGEKSVPHWHVNFDEWWIVILGTLKWHISEAPTHPDYSSTIQSVEHVLEEEDMIYVPKHYKHSIENVGDTISVRLAIATPEAPHIYEKKWINDEFKDA